MNTIREIQQNNEKELQLNIAGTNSSWHEQYIYSPWIYIGNLHTILTEGDIICLLSQYGEIEDIHLLRHNDTGISKGYAFIKYNDPRSCILAIDNFIGISICNKLIRIDHVTNYRVPKSTLSNSNKSNKDNDYYKNCNDTNNDETTTVLERTAPGHAYIGVELANEYTLQNGVDLFATTTITQKKQSLVSSGKAVPKSALATELERSSDDDNNHSNSSKGKSKSNDDDDSNNLPQQQQQGVRDVYDSKTNNNNNNNNEEKSDNNSRKKRKVERQHKRQDKLQRQQHREEKKLRKEQKAKQKTTTTTTTTTQRKEI